jgi:hypothetical protein
LNQFLDKCLTFLSFNEVFKLDSLSFGIEGFVKFQLPGNTWFGGWGPSIVVLSKPGRWRIGCMPGVETIRRLAE